MFRRFVVAMLVVIPLLVGSHRVLAQSGVQRHSRYVLVYGYIRDRHPDTDSTLDIWSKTSPFVRSSVPAMAMSGTEPVMV